MTYIGARNDGAFALRYSVQWKKVLCACLPYQCSPRLQQRDGANEDNVVEHAEPSEMELVRLEILSL
jgi:hypothetical protein